MKDNPSTPKERLDAIKAEIAAVKKEVKKLVANNTKDKSKHG